jgi:hypothetical protein
MGGFRSGDLEVGEESPGGTGWGVEMTGVSVSFDKAEGMGLGNRRECVLTIYDVMGYMTR